jgi:hypothetical protein
MEKRGTRTIINEWVVKMCTVDDIRGSSTLEAANKISLSLVLVTCR